MLRDALVILSGGQDSTTCLYWAKTKFARVHALTFNYGQRHAIELEAAKTVAGMAGVATHEIVDMGKILHGASPLVGAKPVGEYSGPSALPGGVEPTFVPARNLLFLTLAANRAMCLCVTDLVTGVCEEDFGGYPDCRRVFIDSVEDTLRLGLFGDKTDQAFHIHTPLMHLSKKESVIFAQQLTGCMEALAYTHTCYHGVYPPNPYNHASILRARGFAEAGVADPLIVRAKQEGKLPADWPDSGLVEGTRYALTAENS